LTFAESQYTRDDARLHLLYQRCLVVTNNYLEFWVRYVSIFEQCDELEGACNLIAQTFLSGRLQKRPDVLVMWSELEEKRGRCDNARSILDALLGTFATGNIELTMRRIAIERRAGKMPQCGLLLLKFTDEAPDLKSSSFLSRHYAKFCEEELQDPDSACKVYEDAWRKGCRDLAFLMEYVVFTVRHHHRSLPEGHVTMQGIKLFEEALDPAMAKYTDDEACTVWSAYINFLLTYGAPIQQLRRAQSSSRAHFATRRAHLHGYGGTSQTKRSAPELVTIESSKAPRSMPLPLTRSPTASMPDKSLQSPASLDSVVVVKDMGHYSDAVAPEEPTFATMGA